MIYGDLNDFVKLDKIFLAEGGGTLRGEKFPRGGEFAGENFLGG